MKKLVLWVKLILAIPLMALILVTELLACLQESFPGLSIIMDSPSLFFSFFQKPATKRPGRS